MPIENSPVRVAAIGRRTGLDRKTVRKYLDQGLRSARYRPPGAAAGEGDDALGQQVEQVVVAPEGGGASVRVPVGLADHLVHAVAFGPLGGDAFHARSAAVHEHHVAVLGPRPVEAGEDGVDVSDVLAAGHRDQGAVGQVRVGLAVLAGVDGRRGELAGLAVVAPYRGRQVSPVASR